MPGKPSVLIVNSENWMGLARLPQLLHQAGICVDVLGVISGEIGKSIHVRWMIPASVERIVDAIKAHLAIHRDEYKWVILGDEPSLFAMYDHCREDWAADIFPVDVRTDAPEVLTSKALFTLRCQYAGLPMPRSVVAQSPTEIHQAALEIGFPVVLKTNRGTAGGGVRVARNADELSYFANELAGNGPFVVQQFIDGQVVSTPVLFSHGKPICWWAGYRHEVFPEPFGPSCSRQEFWHPEIASLLASLGKLIGFHGLAGVDWMTDSSGNLYLLEINARPVPGYSVARLAGVDFPAGIKEFLKPNPLPLPVVVSQARSRNPHVIYMWPQHPRKCIIECRWRGLLLLLPGVAKYDIPWGEPKMLLAQTGKLLKLWGGSARQRLERSLKRLLHRHYAEANGSSHALHQHHL